MTDYNVTRSVVSELTNNYVSLEERDRLAESEELLHLCSAYKQLTHAAHVADESDVWDEQSVVGEMIEDRLEGMTWKDQNNE